MKNIVLITIPKIDDTLPPAAFAILSPIIERVGYEPKILDFNLELSSELSFADWQNLLNYCELSAESLDITIANKITSSLIKHLNQIITDKTAYLAFSVFSIYSIRVARLMFNTVRKTFPHLSIICGGTAVSSKIDNMKVPFGEEVLKDRLVDFCIYGEGEIALENLLNGNFAYPGINSRNFQQIKELDSLPFADYKNFNIHRYLSNRLLITGSRGCVRDCTFCDIATAWPSFRYRSAENIVEEIRQNFYETGISRFEFTDSLINGSTKNFHRFNILLSEAKAKDPALANITYSGQFICKQSSNMLPEIYEFMHHAGCRQITVGIESFCEHIRYHMRKKFTNEDIDYHFDQCARWAIPNVLLMIVGYPTETIEDHDHTIKTLERYQNYGKMGVIDYIRWGLTMHIYEDTPLTKMFSELGINSNLHNVKDGIYSWTSNKNLDLTLEERVRRRIELHEVSYKLGYKMPNTRTELLSLKSLLEGTY